VLVYATHSEDGQKEQQHSERIPLYPQPALSGRGGFESGTRAPS
jgi:hypothetical protein